MDAECGNNPTTDMKMRDFEPPNFFSGNVISAIGVSQDMTVKAVRGRRRYTAFVVPMGADRRSAESAVSRIASAKVITCGKGYAVIRSSPEDRDALESHMHQAMPTSTAFDCSGTLKALRTRHPQLNAPRKRRRRLSGPKREFPNTL